MKKKTGVLLVNLGTPQSPSYSDVKRYLIEFLTDGRVIDSPWLWRQILVRGMIVPTRCKQSASSYQQIWTKEGSPLKVYSQRLQMLLQEKLGDDFLVELAMRYQGPSIPEALSKMNSVNRLIILPLFPQYASATTGSVYQKTMEALSQWQVIPELKFISHFCTFPEMIKAFCAVAKPFDCDQYDHILFSFHGLPQKQILKASRQKQCLALKSCCHSISEDNQGCYAAQCYATAHALASALNLSAERFSVAFQSRLGKDPWLQPYTSSSIMDLAKKGKKRVLVFCPSFVCDCLETIYEIAIEYTAEFKHAGGERLDLVPGLNDHPRWIDALAELIEKNHV